MPTEAQLVRSTRVVENAAGQLGIGSDPAALLRRLTVTNPEDTQILQITFTDGTAEGAKRGANAFAVAYIEERGERAEEWIDAQSDRLQVQIDDKDTLLANPELTEGQRATLEAQKDALILQQGAIAASTADPGEVNQRAARPTVPITPKHQVDLALGALLGLAAGIALASVREQMRDRLESPADFRGALRAPTLGVIPDSPLLRGSSPRLVTVDEPRSAAAEAYRTLRTNLFAVCKQTKIRTILFTGPREGEGKTTTAVNVAVAIAQTGRSVILISADLRVPHAHSLLGVGNERGLGQVLQGTLAPSEAIVPTTIPHLEVIPPGPVAEIHEPVELLQSARMFEVIRRCRQADFVIIEGPSLEPVADSLVLADLVDGVIVVADAKWGTRASLAQSRHQLQQVGARVIGGVLNRARGGRTLDVYGIEDLEEVHDVDGPSIDEQPPRPRAVPNRL
jgi:capsular exopolysaccharide synthesis family protein